MHGHDRGLAKTLELIHSWIGAASLVLTVAVFLFALGLLPIPIGYGRGKVKWLMWCGTGMHAHTVYWWGGDRGFQAMHPAERGEI